MGQLGIENRTRMQLQRFLNLFIGALYRLEPLQLDVGDVGELLEAKDQNQFTPSMGNLGINPPEESHFVDGFDVLIDHRIVQRFADFGRNVAANRLGLHPQVADNLDLAERPRRLRASQRRRN